jgi:WD40 repeat protein
VIRDYGDFLPPQITSIALTPYGKYLFAGTRNGSIKQICLETQKLVHDYCQVHDQIISCLQITRDSKYLVSAGHDTSVQKISITDKAVVEYFANVSRFFVTV